MSAVKRVILTKLCCKGKTEEHIERLQIEGLDLISYVGHEKFSLATYVHPKLKPLVSRIQNNALSISICLKDLTIVNVYKPPSAAWSNTILQP